MYSTIWHARDDNSPMPIAFQCHPNGMMIGNPKRDYFMGDYDFAPTHPEFPAIFPSTQPMRRARHNIVFGEKGIEASKESLQKENANESLAFPAWVGGMNSVLVITSLVTNHNSSSVWIMN